MDRLWKEERIIQWARERGILNEDSKTRALKISEEAGEYSRYTLREDVAMQQDTIGDLYMALIITAYVEGWDMDECISLAMSETEGRTGETVNGVFIKDNDLHKE